MSGTNPQSPRGYRLLGAAGVGLILLLAVIYFVVNERHPAGEKVVNLGVINMGQDGVVYACLEPGVLRGYGQDGSSVWEATGHGCSDWFTGVDATIDGTVYAVSLDGYFYSFAPDGSRNWKVHAVDPVWDCRGTRKEFTVRGVPIILSPDRIAVYGQNWDGFGGVEGLFSAGGEELASCNLENVSTYASWSESGNWQTGKGRLFLYSELEGGVAVSAFDTEGSLLWERQLDSAGIVDPGAAEGLALKRLFDGFQCLQRISSEGENTWKYDLPTPASSLKQGPGSLILGFAAHDLLVLDTALDGADKLAWRYRVTDGNYLDAVVGNDGIVTALRANKRGYFLDEIEDPGVCRASMRVDTTDLSINRLLADDGTLYYPLPDGRMGVATID